MRLSPDPAALLVALVLCPRAYSRNQFFVLYKDPEALAARRRASLIRSIIAELTHADPLRRGRVVEIVERGISGEWAFTYVVASLGLRRSSLLNALELAIVKYAVSRRIGAVEGLEADERTRMCIENALRGLSPDIVESARHALEAELFDDADEEVDESTMAARVQGEYQE